MAGFSPNEIDQYQPGVSGLDYSFLNFALSSKEGQYEKGVNQVKNVYNSVLSSQLTNPENVAQRDQYIADAQNGIKALSKSDLSLPNNVSQASKIFAPFYQDSDIVNDMYTTKKVQSNAQQISSWKDSKDKDEYAKYNPIQEEYNSQTLLDLQRAKRGDGSIQNIRARSPIPYQDKTEYLTKVAKDQGLSIEYDYGTDAHGNVSPYIKKVTNGAETIPNWKVWAESTLGDKFLEQDKMFGQVSVDRLKNYFLQQNPNLSESEINNTIAQNRVNQFQSIYDNKFKEYKGTIDNYDGRIAEIQEQSNGRKQTPQEQQLLNLYTNGKKTVQSLKDNLETEQKSVFEPSKDALLQKISANPVQYYADLEKETAIDNFAKGITALGSTKIEYNQAFGEQQQMKYNYTKLKQDYQLGMLGIGVDQEKTKIEAFKAGLIDAQGNPINQGNSYKSGTLLGKDVTDVTNIGNAYDVYKDKQKNLFNTAMSAVFDYNGVAGVLANKTIGLDPKTITQFSEAMRKWADPSAGELNDNDKNIIKNVQQKLNDKGYKSDYSVESIFNTVNQLAQDESKRKDLTGIEKNRTDSRVISAGIEAENNLKVYQASENARQKLFTNELATNKDLQKFVTYKDESGNTLDKGTILALANSGVVQKETDGSLTYNGYTFKPDVISSKEIAQQIPHDYISGNGVTISKQEIADAYKTNTLGLTKDRNTPLGILSTGNKQIYLDKPRYDEIQNVLSKLKSNIGSSEDLSNIDKTVNQHILKNLPEYQSETGKYGVVTSWSTDNKKQQPFVLSIGKELGLPSNQLGVYTADDKPQQIDNKDGKLSAIQNLLSSEGNIQDYVTAIKSHNVGFKGRQMWEVVLKPDASDKVGKEDLKFGDVKYADLPKRFFVEADPGTISPTLSSYPQSNLFNVHQDILNGNQYIGSSYLSAAGFPYTLTPNKSKDPDYVIFNANPTTRNPQTGQVSPDKSAEQIFYLKGPNAKNIDGLVQYLDQLGLGYIDNKNTILTKYNKTSTH